MFERLVVLAWLHAEGVAAERVRVDAHLEDAPAPGVRHAGPRAGGLADFDMEALPVGKFLNGLAHPSPKLVAGHPVEGDFACHRRRKGDVRTYELVSPGSLKTSNLVAK